MNISDKVTVNSTYDVIRLSYDLRYARSVNLRTELLCPLRCMKISFFIGKSILVTQGTAFIPVS